MSIFIKIDDITYEIEAETFDPPNDEEDALLEISETVKVAGGDITELPLDDFYDFYAEYMDLDVDEVDACIRKKLYRSEMEHYREAAEYDWRQ